MTYPRELREQAVNDYLAGYPSTEVAERHGVPSSRVRVWVARAGHAMRPRGRSAPRHGLETSADDLAYKGDWVREGLILRPDVTR